MTVSRLALAVCVFAFIDYELYFWALALFVIAAITDALDGYFARLLKQDTPIGRQLDPLIDKVIVSGCYIYLATIPGTGVLPWMVTAIVVRELLIQGLRSHLEGQGQAVRGSDGGQAQDGRPVPVDLGRPSLSGARTRSACRLLSGSATSSPGWPSRSPSTAAFRMSGSRFPSCAARHDVAALDSRMPQSSLEVSLH